MSGCSRAVAKLGLIVLCAPLVSHAAPKTPVFGAPVVLQTPVYTENAVAADLNGDNQIDVIAGKNFADPVLFLNDGGGLASWSTAGHAISSGNTQQEVYVADMNGDHHPDVIAVGFNNPTKLYLNNGTANPFAAVTATNVNPGSTDSSTGVAVGDVNGDGFPDLVLVNTNHIVNRVILNNGTTQPFAGATVKNIGVENGYGSGIALLDANEDGRLDVVMAFSDLSVPNDPAGVLLYLNNGTNDPFNAVTPKVLSSASATQVAVADVNADGHADILIGAGGQGADNLLLLHSGSKTQPYGQPFHFAAANTVPGCISIAIADIDGNGSADVAFGCGFDPNSGPHAAGAIYLNNGTADPFKGVAAVDIPVHEGSDYVRSAQFVALEGDGKLGLLIGELGINYLPMHLDSPPVAHDDSFAVTLNHPVDTDVAANDVDSDGSIDRTSVEITQNPSHGTLHVDAPKGAVSFEPNLSFVGDDSFQYLVRDNDGVKSNVATAVVHVQGMPFADNDAASVLSGASADIDVLHNDTVAGGTLDPASVTITLAPSHGTATVSQGRISYQSTAGFVGTDVLQYTVKDNLGVTSPNASVTFAVSAAQTSSTTTPTTTPTGGKKGGGGAADALLIVAASVLIARRRRTRFCDAAKGWRPNS
jgi:hypothetical protein